MTTDDTATTQNLTIKDYIAYAQQLVNGGKYPEYARDILASLQELQRYREAAAKVAEEVPEPDEADACEFDNEDQVVARPDYDELRARCVALQARLKRLEGGLREPTPEMLDAAVTWRNKP